MPLLHATRVVRLFIRLWNGGSGSGMGRREGVNSLILPHLALDLWLKVSLCFLHCNFGVIANAACHLLLAKLPHKSVSESVFEISRPLARPYLIFQPDSALLQFCLLMLSN